MNTGIQSQMAMILHPPCFHPQTSLNARADGDPWESCAALRGVDPLSKSMTPPRGATLLVPTRLSPWKRIDPPQKNHCPYDYDVSLCLLLPLGKRVFFIVLSHQDGATADLHLKHIFQTDTNLFVFLQHLILKPLFFLDLPYDLSLFDQSFG